MIFVYDEEYTITNANFRGTIFGTDFWMFDLNQTDLHANVNPIVNAYTYSSGQVVCKNYFPSSGIEPNSDAELCVDVRTHASVDSGNNYWNDIPCNIGYINQALCSVPRTCALVTIEL